MGLHALLIEDNESDAQQVRELVDEVRLDIELTHVMTLQAAIGILGERTFDIILLDLSLPDARKLDGLERINASAPLVPVIVLTGLASNAIAKRAIQQGAQDYLVKDRFDAHQFVRSVQYAIERQRLSEEIHWKERTLEVVFEAIPVGVVRIGGEDEPFLLNYMARELLVPDGDIVLTEDALAERLGFSPKDRCCTGTPPQDHEYGDRKVRVECRCIISDDLHRGTLVVLHDVTNDRKLEALKSEYAYWTSWPRW